MSSKTMGLRYLAVAAIGLMAIVAFASHWFRPPHRNSPRQPAQNLAPDVDGVFHVRVGESIQAALDAASQSECKVVRVHAGVYRPRHYAQALIRFNGEHDGIQLEGEAGAVLTAANESLGDKLEADFPAAVNHVVYFGDGITAKTVLRGFTITGANGFIGTDQSLESIEPASDDVPNLEKGLFFFADGGAIKVFGRSAPTLEKLEVRGNRTRLCGAGVSVEQRGYKTEPVVLRNIRFIDNHCPATGAAVDILGDSAAVIEDCLFVGNIANTGMDEVAADYGLRYNPEHGCGALTVFPKSVVTVRRCTFTNNWNGADDKGDANVYQDCIFWSNSNGDGSRPGKPYEIDIANGEHVTGCYFGGNDLLDLRQTIDPTRNHLDAPDPQFDESYLPQAAAYAKVGYRPRAR